MLNVTPVSQRLSFEYCSVIRHGIRCALHHCAENAKWKHICSKGPVLDCCFLISHQKDLLSICSYLDFTTILLFY